MELLRHRTALFDTKFDKIMYYIPSELHEAHTEFLDKLRDVCPEIQILYGLPTEEETKSNFLPKLLLVDDQMSALLNSPFMETFFCATSHHFNNTIFFTLQNYYSSARSKTILRQCVYKIIFNDPGDRILIRNISCTVSPNPQFLYKCFQMLEQKFPTDLQYLLIDTNPRSPMKQMVIRSKIFPNSSNEIKPICFFTQ